VPTIQNLTFALKNSTKRSTHVLWSDLTRVWRNNKRDTEWEKRGSNFAGKKPSIESEKVRPKIILPISRDFSQILWWVVVRKLPVRWKWAKEKWVGSVFPVLQLVSRFERKKSVLTKTFPQVCQWSQWRWLYRALGWWRE